MGVVRDATSPDINGEFKVEMQVLRIEMENSRSKMFQESYESLRPEVGCAGA
jgi:hypothetical protein